MQNQQIPMMEQSDLPPMTPQAQQQMMMIQQQMAMLSPQETQMLMMQQQMMMQQMTGNSAPTSSAKRPAASVEVGATNLKKLAVQQRRSHNEADKKQTTVFVGGLRKTTDEDKLMAHFSKYGPVEKVDLKRLPDGTSRGFAFVKFPSKEHVEKVVEARAKHMIDNKWVAVLARDSAEFGRGNNPESGNNDNRQADRGSGVRERREKEEQEERRVREPAVSADYENKWSENYLQLAQQAAKQQEGGEGGSKATNVITPEMVQQLMQMGVIGGMGCGMNPAMMNPMMMNPAMMGGDPMMCMQGDASMMTPEGEKLQMIMTEIKQMRSMTRMRAGQIMRMKRMLRNVEALEKMSSMESTMDDMSQMNPMGQMNMMDSPKKMGGGQMNDQMNGSMNMGMRSNGPPPAPPPPPPRPGDNMNSRGITGAVAKSGSMAPPPPPYRSNPY